MSGASRSTSSTSYVFLHFLEGKQEQGRHGKPFSYFQGQQVKGQQLDIPQSPLNKCPVAEAEYSGI